MFNIRVHLALFCLQLLKGLGVLFRLFRRIYRVGQFVDPELQPPLGAPNLLIGGCKRLCRLTGLLPELDLFALCSRQSGTRAFQLSQGFIE